MLTLLAPARVAMKINAVSLKHALKAKTARTKFHSSAYF
jgi:hypothetical protein